METSFLKPVYDRSGPWCSVYLPTSHTQKNTEHETELRWRDLRGRLAELGAPPADLRAIDGEVGPGRAAPGPYGRAVFAAHGEVALVRELPAPTAQVRAVFGELPDLVPLLARTRDLGPHLLVFADHSGADVEVHGGRRGPAAQRVDARGMDAQRVDAQGETRHDRRQHHSDSSWHSPWQDSARAVAARVEQIAGEHTAGVIVLTGDRRMRAPVLAELGPPWRARTVELAGSDAPGADAESVRRSAARAAAEFEQAWRAQVVDRYAAGLANGKAVEGPEAVVASLRSCDVDMLLVRYDAADSGAPVWWGPEPGQLAVRPEELAATHAQKVSRARGVDALIRAAALEDGGLLLFSGGEPGPDGSAGAILRRG